MERVGREVLEAPNPGEELGKGEREGLDVDVDEDDAEPPPPPPKDTVGAAVRVPLPPVEDTVEVTEVEGVGPISGVGVVEKEWKPRVGVTPPPGEAVFCTPNEGVGVAVDTFPLALASTGVEDTVGEGRSRVGETLVVAHEDGEPEEALLALGKALVVAFPCVPEAVEERVGRGREGEALLLSLPPLPPPALEVRVGVGVRDGGGEEEDVELPSVAVCVGGALAVGGAGVGVGTPPEAVTEVE